MNKIVPIAIGIVIVAALAYTSFQGAKKVSQSVVEQQSEGVLESTGQPSDSAVTPAKGETVNLATGISLIVSSPSNNTTVASSSLQVKGKTVPGAEVFVNDAETKADSNGNFSVTLTLDEGDNYILVVANDTNGNYSEKDIAITYTP